MADTEWDPSVFGGEQPGNWAKWPMQTSGTLALKGEEATKGPQRGLGRRKEREY